MDAIVVSGLTKRYGDVTAVSDLSFTVASGRVTGLLGPNGAGKTTTLRALLGFVRPDAGSATFGGTPYRELERPAQLVGAVLDSGSFHPGRKARDHLAIVATTAGIDLARVDAVLVEVDLAQAAGRRVGEFSLGMRQRLALATALLGDPDVLVLDEPANGLDPDGVHWLRMFLRNYAASGRTVLVSSHMLAEVAQTVDDVVIISAGRLVRQGTLADVALDAAPATRGMRLRTTEPAVAQSKLGAAGLDVVVENDGALLVSGAPADAIGRAVLEAGLTVYEMTPVGDSLEDAFFALTHSTKEGIGS